MSLYIHTVCEELQLYTLAHVLIHYPTTHFLPGQNHLRAR